MLLKTDLCCLRVRQFFYNVFPFQVILPTFFTANFANLNEFNKTKGTNSHFISLLYNNTLIDVTSRPRCYETLASEQDTPEQLVVLKDPDFRLQHASYDTLALQVAPEYFRSGTSVSHKTGPGPDFMRTE